MAGNRVGIINTRHMLFENSRLVVLFNRVFTRCNSRIIAVSRHVRDRLIKEGINENRIAMIYNGVDPDEWTYPSPNAFRKDAGISDKDMLITSVSRFSPEKGHDFIIDVIGYMRKNRSAWALRAGSINSCSQASGRCMRLSSKRQKPAVSRMILSSRAM